MAMKNLVKGIVAVCAVGILMVNLLFPTVASAKNDNKNNGNTGVGQTQVHIHHVSGITANKGSVTVTMEDGTKYSGTLTGSTLTLEMGTTENGFDIAKGEALTVSYATGDGKTGLLTITHKEGNGDKIKNEHDEGLNNFNGTYSVDGQNNEEETVEEETVEEEVPLAEAPEVEIEEEDVPLADLPKTGDPFVVMFGVMAALSGSGVATLLLKKKF